MIPSVTDYRSVDKRAAPWAPVLNPLSLQKRGLVQWIPLGRIDSLHGIAADRRFRPATSVALPGGWWFGDEYRGNWGAVQVIAGGVPYLVPKVTTVPLTITCWMRRIANFTQGINVWIGRAHASVWDAFYLQLEATMLNAVQVETTVFGAAMASLAVPFSDWVFCAGVFVSNSDRWAYCNGIVGAHNTDALTPVVAKDTLALGGPTFGGTAGVAISCSMRDVRIYNYALELGELEAIYRNPYDIYQQLDRDDDFQFFVTSTPPVIVEPPLLTTSVTLHTPEMFAPVGIALPAQSITTAAPAPAILADLGFQVSALTVAVTAVTPASVNIEEEVVQEDEQTLEPFNFKVRIVNYVGGDDLRISRTYTELPGGIIVNKAYLTIKRHAKDDTDAEAALQKQVTASEGIAGQITDAITTGGSIALYFDLTGAETATLTPLIPCHYDVQIVSQAGAVYTCEKGVIVMQQGVTDATS
jgi:hypothetical protein